jgi:NAD(P)-dependent dehydrogenase (short-subunit alcohol dehydrogenase family)
VLELRPDGSPVVLVTGAAGAGIGHAIATRFARDGATVVLTDAHEGRTADAAAALRARVGEQVAGICMDVADRERVDEVIAGVLERLGSIDVLVNNAAVNEPSAIVSMTPPVWDRTLAIDVSAPWYLTRSVLPSMMGRGRGAIVNVSSVAAFGGAGGQGAYAAAKAALQSLTRTTALEAGPHGVRCNAVAPGIIRTRFVEKNMGMFTGEIERVPLGRFGEPDDIADVVAFLASDDARYITGETLTVSGGWYMRP